MVLSTTRSFRCSTLIWFSGTRTGKYWPAVLIIAESWKGGDTDAWSTLHRWSVSIPSYEAARLDGAREMAGDYENHTVEPRSDHHHPVASQHRKNFLFRFRSVLSVPMNSGVLFPTTNVIDTYIPRPDWQVNTSMSFRQAGVYQSLVGFCVVIWVTGLSAETKTRHYSRRMEVWQIQKAKRFQFWINVVLILITLSIVLPFVLVFISSLTDENIDPQRIFVLPGEIQLFMLPGHHPSGWENPESVRNHRFCNDCWYRCKYCDVRSVGISAFCLKLPYRRAITFFVFFTMLFNAFGNPPSVSMSLDINLPAP